MSILLDYIKEKIALVLCILFTQGVMILALWVQGTTFEDALYASALSLVIFAVIGCMDFIYYNRRRKALLHVKNSVGYDISMLPESHSPLECEYQELLKNLFSQKADAESEAVIKKKEMLDYYSLWGHQIKTPISGMRLLLQAQKDGLMARADESGEASDWNSRMTMELSRVEQYVEMVLSYLRIGDMGTDLVLQNYPLESVVKQAVKKFSKEFLYRKIHLELEPFHMDVLTDEKWVLLVLEQVLSNALKYTPEGGSIKIYPLEAEKRLVIEDTGIGIRAEDLPRVCEKGFTGYNGREDKKSTGIGLYLCKSIMNKLRHELKIESEIGCGTRVLLRFDREERVIE